MESLLSDRLGGDVSDVVDQIDAKRSESEELASALEGFLAAMQSNSHLTGRSQDEDWFDGVQSRFHTKESHMRYDQRHLLTS